MKRITALLFIFFFNIFCQYSYPAQKPPIKSASEYNYPPFCIVTDKGKADGFSVELLRSALRAVDMGVEFKVGPWEEIKEELKEGKIQVLPLVGRTPERETEYDFTFSYLTLHGAIFVRKGENRIKTVEDLADKEVIVMVGDNAEEYVKRERIFKHIISVGTYTDAMKLLSSGKHDAVIVQRLMGIQLLKDLGINNVVPLKHRLINFRQEFSFAVRKGDKELLSLLNEGLMVVMSNGVFERLHKKWFVPILGSRLTIKDVFKYVFLIVIPVVFMLSLSYVFLLRSEVKRKTKGLLKENEDRKRAEESLRESEIRLSELYENMKSGVAVYDVIEEGKDFVFRKINRAGAESSKVKKEEVIGKRVTEVFPGVRDFGLLAVFQQVWKSGEPQHYPVSLYKDERLISWYENYVYKLPTGEIVAIYDDISDRKKTEEEIINLSKLVLENPNPVFRVKKDGVILSANGASENILRSWNKRIGERVSEGWMKEIDSVCQENILKVQEETVKDHIFSFEIIPIKGTEYVNVYGRNITERRRAQKRLAESENKFRSITENAVDYIFIKDRSRHYTFINQAMQRLLGLPEEEILGKTPEEIFDPEQAGVIKNVDDRAFSGETVNETRSIVIMEKEVFLNTVQAPLTWEDGEVSSIMGIVRDITQIKRFEQELQDNEENLLVTLNSIGDGVIATDREGKITRMNPVAEKLTGWLFNEAKGALLKDVFRVISTKTREVIPSPFEKVLKHGDVVGLANHTLLIARDGTERKIADSGSPIRNMSGEIIGIVLVFRDVTEAYEIEEMLRHAQKMEAIGLLAGGVAHDFNNMLAGIMGCADVLATILSKDERSKKYIDLIIDASTQASSLTEKMLAFSRKSPAEKEIFDAHDLIQKISAMLRRTVDRRIDIKLDLKAGISTVEGDLAQIQNVLLNLGINARDAMPKGGTLTFRTKNLDFSKIRIKPDLGTKIGKYVEIDVEDNGIGMSREVKARIFEPFFTTKGIGKGTGLGLSVAYRTISDNQGFINAYSELDKGTNMKVYLPIVEISRTALEKKIKPEVVYGEGCILLVDDEKIIRAMSEDMLSRLGYNILLAEDGKEGVELYKEKHDLIDLVILDVVMPRMGGQDAFYALKAFDPDVKVLISSGFVQDANTSKLMEDGARGFIQKPYRWIELSKKIAEILS